MRVGYVGRAVGSGAQESVDFRAELGRVLEEEPMPRVGIDAEPGIGQVSGEQVAVLRGDHHIVVTVGH